MKKTRSVWLAMPMAALLVGGGASAAAAVPTPGSGPNAGGTTVTDALPNVEFVDIEAGYWASYAIDAQGRAYAWGYNYFGELGIGSNEPGYVPRPTPHLVDIPAGEKVTKIDADWGFAMALTESGKVFTWGTGRAGQLGTGDDNPQTTDRYTPGEIAAEGKSFVDIAVGINRSYAIDSDGKLWGWGSSASWQPLGNGTAPSSPVLYHSPQALVVPDDVSFSQVDVGYVTPAALSTTGEVWVWGQTEWPQLPPGTDGLTPKPLPDLPPIVEIATGVSHTSLLDAEGNAYAWGDNWYGSLGIGSTTGYDTPQLVQMDVSGPFAQLSTGNQMSVGLATSGEVYAWGTNEEGVVGIPSVPVATGVDVPTRVSFPDDVTVKKVSAGSSRHVLALTDSGEIYGWGINSSGEIGIDPAEDLGEIPEPRLMFTGAGAPTDLSVQFGGVLGTNTVLNADGTWSSDTPGGCGPVDIEVGFTQFGAEHVRTYPGGFTYEGAEPEFTQHPKSVELADSELFSGAVEVSGDPAPTVRWQQSPNGADGWMDIEAAGTTIEQEISEPTFFRAVAENCFGTVLSEVAAVTIAEDTGTGGGEEPGPDPDPEPVKPAPVTPAPETLTTTGAGGQPVLAAVAALTIVAGLALAIARRRQRS